ncbi:MAG: hypothetical protein KGS72_16060 [Cyanobacteria bacterium REEB67]|nr:hypothetical protein [Cyanobacteria bacterium REEB67]
MSIALTTLLALAGIALSWLFLLFRLLQKALNGGGGKGKDKGDGEDQGDSEAKAKAKAAEEARRAKELEALRQAQEAEAKRQAEKRAQAEAKARQKVVEALQKDPLLRRQMEKLAKVNELPQMSDEQKAKEIMHRVPAHVLQVLVVAGTQEDIEMDLDTVFTREKSLFPTHDIEPVPMNGLEQMHQILPEQMIMDDDFFYGALVNEELLVMQPYERKVERKTLHISLDLSSSMEGPMSDGLTRHNWSRGITVSLLLKAVNGEATYMLRGFAGQPYTLDLVDSPEKAQALIDKLLSTAASGADTNIWGALKQAVIDVRAVKRAGDVADILVITDGQDNKANVYGAGEMKALFGEDIRLHVVAIGMHAPVLQSGATSYREFQ